MDITGNWEMRKLGNWEIDQLANPQFPHFLIFQYHTIDDSALSMAVTGSNLALRFTFFRRKLWANWG
jgi:hypothetical protein